MHFGAGLASGSEVIGVTWREQVGNESPLVHGAVAGADGTLGFDIRLANDQAHGIAGTTTVLWHGSASSDCNQVGSWLATLQGEDAKHLDLATDIRGMTATFDGERYQLFWVGADRKLYHRWVSEAGELGPVHDLQLSAGNGDFSCLYAASDRAGTTILVEGDGYVVDPDTGARRLVFDGPLPVFGDAFYFAGEFHVRSANMLYAFPATSTGSYTTRTVPAELETALAYRPGDATLFVEISGERVIEVDPSFTVVRRHLDMHKPFGVFGSNLVHFIHTTSDRIAKTPGTLDLVREDAWRARVADDELGDIIEECP
jgi:hypothetical protein